ncbi:MAG: GNAT family N-acetyltransferase [Bacilli bacterium]
MEWAIHRGAPETIHKLGTMLDAVFRSNQPPGEGMPREFPHLFSEQNAHNLYYIADGEQPVSMVGVLVQEVLMQGAAMPVASIGSVGTLSAYEGKGLASRILDRVAADLTDQQIPLMLVSGDRGLYRRAHCAPVGRMFAVEVTADEAQRIRKRLPVESTPQVREISAAQRASSAARLLPLYHREPFRYRRTEQEMAVLLNAVWFARLDYDQRLFEVTESGRPVAYLVGYATRNAPETVEIMEYAGSRLAFLHALTDILQSFSARAVRFHVHIRDTEMLYLQNEWGVSARATALQGTVRVLNVPALFRNLNPAIREQSGAEATVREQSGVWNVALGANSRVFTSPEQIGAWLFDHDESCLGIPFVHTDDLNYI